MICKERAMMQRLTYESFQALQELDLALDLSIPFLQPESMSDRQFKMIEDARVHAKSVVNRLRKLGGK